MFHDLLLNGFMSCPFTIYFEIRGVRTATSSGHQTAAHSSEQAADAKPLPLALQCGMGHLKYVIFKILRRGFGMTTFIFTWKRAWSPVYAETIESVRSSRISVEPIGIKE
jgi:hypothetical protein